MKLKKHINHDATQQDKKLHGHFKKSVEYQTQPAFFDAVAGDVTLYLTLVGTKIREGQKHTSRDARPKSIPAFYIKRKIHQLHLAIHARNAECIGKMNVFRKTFEGHGKGGCHAQKNHKHLLLLGYCYRSCTPTHGVQNHETARDDVERGEVPAQDGGKYDRRGINGDTCPQSPLDQKQN